MLNGHMDPGCEMSGWTVDPYGAKFEDGWIWGMGAHDDKGGVVAAISAVEAIVRSGTRLKGDVLVTPVIAHKLGGAGTRALLKHGVKADLCINMEHSNNSIANVCVGVVMVRFICSTPDLFFRYSAEARAAFMSAIEQQMAIVQRIGPSLTPIPQGGWMRFEPHPELPGFPALTYDVFHREHYYYKNYTGQEQLPHPRAAAPARVWPIPCRAGSTGPRPTARSGSPRSRAARTSPSPTSGKWSPSSCAAPSRCSPPSHADIAQDSPRLRYALECWTALNRAATRRWLGGEAAREATHELLASTLEHVLRTFGAPPAPGRRT